MSFCDTLDSTLDSYLVNNVMQPVCISFRSKFGPVITKIMRESLVILVIIISLT